MKPTKQQIKDHVTTLEKASEEELDDLLTDLLVHVYPTKQTQNS